MNAAVCIETRPLESFPDTVRQHMAHLKGFDLVIFGSEQNSNFLETNISNFQHHEVKFPSGFGQFEYNLTLTNPKFWELLYHYDRVLIFQHDSMLLRDGIEEFLKWDYVGAPWKFQRHGGNGGLSIRNPKAMHELCTLYEWKQAYGNEDVFFCNLMYADYNTYKLAPREICEKFSVESIFKLGTLGYHAIDAWLTPEQFKEVRAQHQRCGGIPQMRRISDLGSLKKT